MRLLPLLAAALLTGCGILYTDIKVPRGYRSAAPSEVKGAPDDPAASGRSCQRSALYLVAWGDSSYASAVADALKGAGRDGILYDVKADMKVNSYLVGLYTKVCTVVSGKVAKS
ncbi:MAG: TRL domain-containing protein [Elusimicrobiota bacterium]|nr:TRL domain-containing protein [Elusimicrobiota bacterium]